MAGDTPSGEDCGRSCRKKAEIKPCRLAPDILEIPLDTLRPRDPIATIELGKPSETRTSGETLALTTVIPVNLMGKGWPGSDKAHLAPQYV